MNAGLVRVLQVAMSALSGYVDAIGFMSLGGFYVAFMSGNSTLLGIGAGTWNPHRLELALGLVLAFVVGVALGTLAGGTMQRMRPVGVLLMVGALLAVAAGLDQGGHMLVASLIMAVAMGAVNTVFNRPGFSGVGLTYMTGTLVRVGQRLAEALTGGSWGAVLPDTILWLGMVVGATLGAVAYHYLEVAGLWIGVASVLAMAGLAWWTMPAEVTGTASV